MDFPGFSRVVFSSVQVDVGSAVEYEIGIFEMYKIYLSLVLHWFCVESCGDFYWRDYDGRIPADAIPAGNNSDGLSYIGQAYVHNFGLLLGTIIPHSMEIKIPCYGVVVTNVIIKILCAPNLSKFHWVRTSAEKFNKDMRDQCAVLGGYDRTRVGTLGKLNIGRTREHGDVIIGNIAAYDLNLVWFYYPLDGGEKRASQYEALVYRGDPTLDVDTNSKLIPKYGHKWQW